ncbi:MAG: glycosyltransferase family 4 protein [Ferrovibrio sp.]|uniref:glycosyltransferase n=1 Tax=Ferrovibrio sp. TaxID=1917215 RepID=UPI00261A82D0|nr:glycosyltransferase [Ferrovibrio sp.]MCW0232839.1 glycosyltransferase family 4 protein [Ferrovibrio sp.]
MSRTEPTALVITRTWPDKPGEASHGIFQRLSIFLDALAGRFASVELLAFPPKSADTALFRQAYLEHLRSRFSPQVNLTTCHREPTPTVWPMYSRYLSNAFDVDQQDPYLAIATARHIEAVRSMLDRKPDLIFAHRLHAFTPLLPLLRHDMPPIAFDLDDIEHRALARTMIKAPLWPSERLRMLHVPAVMQRERRAIRASAASFVCSAVDAAHMRALSGRDTVFEIANTVPGPESAVARPADQPGRMVGFVGSLMHPPNADAIAWMIDEIWPLIRRSHPDACLQIAGAGTQTLNDQRRLPDGVEVVGFVDDLDAFYRRTDVILAPLRYGAGTRVKLVEAAAFSAAIVTTKLGAEGLKLDCGRDLLLAEDAPQLAAATCRLLDDPDLRQSLGRAARLQYENEYARDRVVASVDAHFRQILDARRG